jgi:uncharacterized protein YggL (DUF469 family)
MTYTKFASPTNIFTNEPQVRFVPIPDVPRKKKGTTLHDDKFDKLIGFDTALVINENEMGGIRKSLQRYLDNKGMRQTASMRQLKDHKTKSYTVWLVNQPPQVVIPRGNK